MSATTTPERERLTLNEIRARARKLDDAWNEARLAWEEAERMASTLHDDLENLPSPIEIWLPAFDQVRDFRDFLRFDGDFPADLHGIADLWKHTFALLTFAADYTAKWIPTSEDDNEPEAA